MKILRAIFSICLPILCFGITAMAQSYEDVCKLEDGKMVFYFDKTWDADKIKTIRIQFGLDSALVARALKASSSDSVKTGVDIWYISPEANKTVKLWKGINRMKGVLKQNSHAVFFDEPVRSGPGYVDMSQVRFGTNLLKENVIVQYPDGRVKFKLPGYLGASEVLLSGSFNDWSTNGISLRKTTDGWEATTELEPGKYLYKFIVNGSWLTDPNNSRKEGDGFGGKNSIVYIYNYKFELNAYPNAKKVFVAGSFNDWRPKQLEMRKTLTGWVLPMFLQEGTHAYKFIVDGEWITDPNNTITRSDGGGNLNSFTSVGKPTLFKLKGFLQATNVMLVGSFNQWNASELRMDKTSYGWELPYVLRPGNYEYKFVVDGNYIVDPANPNVAGEGDFKNSLISIEPNYTFTLEGYPNAKEVIVTGSFNGWSENHYRMKRLNGVWNYELNLSKGKHRYKFIVDGKWILDPANQLFEGNEFDTGNSVLWIE